MFSDTGSGPGSGKGDDLPLVRRSEFATTDSDVVEQFLDAGYTAANRITVTGVDEDFTFSHSSVTAPGVSINRMRLGVDLRNDACAEAEDPITVMQVLGGHLSVVDTACPEVRAGAGDILMIPLSGPMGAIAEHFDLVTVQLDRPAVLAYAQATTGLEPDRLAFDDITPITADHGRYWTETMTHVRDHVLADPWATARPIALDQAFQSLAAALLSTMPNTALDRANGPEAPPVRGDLPAARLREVVDYLDTHADRPVGPVDIAALAGRPVGEVVEALRRRRGVHPAALLWRSRLRGVRRDLLDADPDSGVTVTGIAARWGFTRPDRFRVAYIHAFGETPDTTLRR